MGWSFFILTSWLVFSKVFLIFGSARGTDGKPAGRPDVCHTFSPLAETIYRWFFFFVKGGSSQPAKQPVMKALKALGLWR